MSEYNFVTSVRAAKEEARRRREGEDLPPIPTPAVSARTPTLQEVPAAMKQMVRHAAQHDWAVELSYAQGPVLDRRDARKYLYIAESLLLRARRGSFRVAAVWLRKPNKSNWAFEFSYAGPPVTKLSSPQLREYLKEES